MNGFNSIFVVDHDQQYTVEGSGQDTVEALRRAVSYGKPRNYYPHIKLVRFNNPTTGQTLYPKFELSKKFV